MTREHTGPSDGLVGPAALIGAAVIWGFFPVATRAVEDTLTPEHMLLAQSLFAALALVPYLAILRPAMPARQHLPRAVMLGLLGTFFTAVPSTYGIQHVEAGTAALLSGTSPVVVLVCSAIFLAERITPRLVGGIGLALIGSVAVATVGDGGFGVTGPALWGSTLVLLSAVIFGAYSVAAKPWFDRIPAASIPIVGRFASLPLAVPLGGSGFIAALGHLAWSGWLAVLAFSVGAGVVANALFAVGLERSTASDAAVYTYLTPLFGVVGGMAFLGESLGAVQVVGGALILIGVGVVTLLPLVRRDAADANVCRG
jgi:drug/metabolite transporter (DMT)-like permease